MNFVELATIEGQTVVITPRYSGQVIRLGATEVVTAAMTPARIYGSGVVEISEGYWDDLMIVEGDYTGPYFDGSTPGASWTGTPHESTSVYAMPIQGPAGEGPWYSGEGHSGCRFVGNPTVVNYNGVGGGQIGLSAIFTEVGAWE